MRQLIALLTHLRAVRLVRYLCVSAVALGVDMGSFLILLSLGVLAAPAAAAGYSLGILAHWLLSSRAVFSDTLAPRGILRTRQKALFVGSALSGLILTTAIVAAGAAVALDPRFAKLVAIGASFALTWLLRTKVVFRVGRAA